MLKSESLEWCNKTDDHFITQGMWGIDDYIMRASTLLHVMAPLLEA